MTTRMGSISTSVALLALMGGVCFGQFASITSPEVAATVINLTGQVSILRDSTPWALSVGQQVKPKQIIITGPDGYAEFQVSDGSTFEVFPNSKVTFRDNPGDWKDLLNMWLGRVKVHIQKLNGQENRNNVRTPTAIISVRGTIFDVEVEETETTVVTVEEGQVAVKHAIFPQNQTRLLNAGESLKVYKNEPLAKSVVDKGRVITGVMRSVADAVYTAVYRTGGRTGSGSSGGSSGGGTGGQPGDHSGSQTPPATGGGTTGGGTTTTTPPGDAGPGAPTAPGH